MFRTGMVWAACAVLLASMAACDSGAPDPVETGDSAPIELGLGSHSLSGNATYLNASDHTGITISVIDDDAGGQPVIGSTTTGSSGKYTINGLPSTGNFTVVAASNSSVEQAVLTGISMPQATIADLGLTGTGTISGNITLADIPMAGLAFVPGTSHVAFTNEYGAFTLSGVPAGTYNVVIALVGNTQENTVTAVSVAVGANTPLSAADTDLAPGFSVFDGLIALDFEETALNKFPFKERDHMRRLNGAGQAILRLTGTSPQHRIYLSAEQATPTEHWGVGATFNLSDYWTEDSELRPAAEVGGIFFAEMGAFPWDPVTNIFAVTRLMADSSGRTLKAEAVLYSCDQYDWSCENRWEFAQADIASGIGLSTNVVLRVACDLDNVSGTYGQCTFGADSGGGFVESQLSIISNFNTAQSQGFHERFVGLNVLRGCCGGGDDGGGEGFLTLPLYAHIEGTVDDVTMADASSAPTFTVYDAMGGTLLDKTKWRNSDLESRGEIYAGVQAYDRRIVFDPLCNFCNNDASVNQLDVEGISAKRYNHLQVDVTVDTALSSVPSATNAEGIVHHGVGGALFNDGTGLIGQVGNVYGIVSLRSPNNDAGTPSWSVGYDVWYCDSNECRPGAGRISIASGTLAVFGSATDTYRLSMNWNEGSNLVFSATNRNTLATASATVDPTATYPVIQPALNPFKGAFAGMIDFESTAAEEFRIAGTMDNFVAY